MGTLLSTDLIAQSWTHTTAANNNWISVGLSPDGTTIVAGTSPGSGNGFVSTNFGVTWITTNSFFPLQYAVASADGKKWVAGNYEELVSLSTNSGVSWYSSGQSDYEDNCLSADGNVLVIVNYALEFSTNFGNSWQTISRSSIPPGRLYVAANGTKWIIFGYFSNPFFYCSTNWGASWTTNSLPSANLSALFALSADGNKIIGAENYNNLQGAIYVSTNSGLSWWKTSAGLNYWNYVACSADGDTLIATAASVNYPYVAISGLYTSFDGGVTWVSNNVPSAKWFACSSSADGSKLVAVADGGGIYTFSSTPRPQLNLTTASNNSVFSWTLPSTNFVLQQNSDLTTPNWSNMTNAPVLNFTNLQNQVTLPVAGGNAFYRLATQ